MIVGRGAGATRTARFGPQRRVVHVQAQTGEAGVSRGGSTATSHAGGAVAPGEIVVIFGTHPGPPNLTSLRLTPDGRFLETELGGVRAFFDGVAALLIYVSAGQVSAVIPRAAARRSTTEIWVELSGLVSNRISLPVVPAVPGLFTPDASGRGQGAILNQDYTGNGTSSPASPGSFVMPYGTGAGLMSPAAADGEVIGSIMPPITAPVRVWFDNVEAQEIWAGAAPGMVNGVFQINARILPSVRGGAVPVRLRIGDSETLTCWTTSPGTSTNRTPTRTSLSAATSTSPRG